MSGNELSASNLPPIWKVYLPSRKARPLQFALPSPRKSCLLQLAQLLPMAFAASEA